MFNTYKNNTLLLMRDYTHKVKTNHRKAVQSSLRAKIHTIV